MVQYTKAETIASLDRAIAEVQGEIHALHQTLSGKEIILRVLKETRDQQESK